MGSRKSRANPPREALVPQRRRGALRVAALMTAAAEVIAERGYEAATMAEIAARAGAQIGSLYRFFPNKEILADSLIQRFGELVEAAFRKIEEQAAVMPIPDLADALLGFFGELHAETRAIVALLDARSDRSAKLCEFHEAALGRIGRILRLRAPQLRRKSAEDIAVILLHNMKTMKSLISDPTAPARSGTIAELREMNRLYLEHKLSTKPRK
jgi:AcrR family transcriptional regulator